MSKKIPDENIEQPGGLTIQAAAHYLSATVWAVRELIWRKEIRATKIGHRLIISRVELDLFLERRMRAA